MISSILPPWVLGRRCNVTYDSIGNVLAQPARTGQRSIGYYGSGHVRRISQGGAEALFSYDPFGVAGVIDVEDSGQV